MCIRDSYDRVGVRLPTVHLHRQCSAVIVCAGSRAVPDGLRTYRELCTDLGVGEVDKGVRAMNEYNANEIRAKILRRRILQLIAENYILSASLISHTLLLSYATVLRHLRVLNQEGYVELYKEGRILFAKIKDNAKQIQIMNSELERLINPTTDTVMSQNVRKAKGIRSSPVSYTHLTLPTILRV